MLGGLPIADRRTELLCDLDVIDFWSAATFVMNSGVEGIFDVQVVPIRCLALSGPEPELDQSPLVWAVPPEASLAG